VIYISHQNNNQHILHMEEYKDIHMEEYKDILENKSTMKSSTFAP